MLKKDRKLFRLSSWSSRSTVLLGLFMIRHFVTKTMCVCKMTFRFRIKVCLARRIEGRWR